VKRGFSQVIDSLNHIVKIFVTDTFEHSHTIGYFASVAVLFVYRIFS